MQEGGTCLAELTPSQREVPAGGAEVEFALTTSRADCAWRAYLRPGIGSVNPSESVGSAEVRVSVGGNPFNTPREAVLSVAGKAALVKQAAGSCNFAISPDRVAFPPARRLRATHDHGNRRELRLECRDLRFVD